MIESRTLATE